MIVVDASVIAELLVRGPGALAVEARLQKEGRWAAPHLLDTEVGQVLRRFELAGKITLAHARIALASLVALPIVRYPHGPLLNRAFDLRQNATIYDATYLVLAETISAPLLTRDAALAHIPGHRAKVDVI